MSQPNQTTIRCQQCGTPVQAQIRTVADAQADPQSKQLLLAGRLNAFQCPKCGFVNQVLTPLLYHDSAKSLLIAFIPMEVSMQSGKPEEKIVGDLLNDLTRSIPKEQFRSYMFSPKRALTMNGLIEQVMEADGVTKEMMDAQKARVELIRVLMAATTEEELLGMIQSNDANLDLAFFQTLALMTQRLYSEGRQEIVAGLMAVQNVLLQHSTYGKTLASQQNEQEEIVRTVADAISVLGENATRADLINLALTYADDQPRLEALVGLVRPAFDYQFFMEFTQTISQAPANQRAAMEKVRDAIQSLIEVMDSEQQAVLQESAQFLQMLVNSPDPDAMIEENIDAVDNTLMSILSANIQEAQRRQDTAMLGTLQTIYQKLVTALQSRMTPELQFVNALLSAENVTTMQQLLDDNAVAFDIQVLLDTCDAVGGVLQQQGQAEALQRLATIRAAIEARLN